MIPLSGGIFVRPERSIVFGSVFLWQHLLPHLGFDFVFDQHERIAELFYRIESARKTELNGRKASIEGAGEGDYGLFAEVAVFRSDRERSLDDRRQRIMRRLGLQVTEERQEGVSKLCFSENTESLVAPAKDSTIERSPLLGVEGLRPLRLPSIEVEVPLPLRA